ncbi:MAG: HRDC domain-containing protein [Planctomycetaceae bacterium]
MLKDQSRQAILGWIGQLIQQGYLNKVGEYSMLQITETGWQPLKGMRHRGCSCPPAPRLLEAAGVLPASTTRIRGSGADRELFEALRGLRTEKANDLGLAPYMVFGDATLRATWPVVDPRVMRLLQVHGVGQKKMRRLRCGVHGALIRDHCRKAGPRNGH